MFGLSAALFYTITNICLRGVTHVDAVWVSALKTVPTLIIVLPMLATRVVRQQPIWTSKGDIYWLIGAGILVQIFGNVAFQWSLGVLGIAISVPLVLGAMLVGGAIVGRVVLREPVRLQTGVGIGILILAVAALSLGAHRSSGSKVQAPIHSQTTQVMMEQTLNAEWWLVAFAVISTLGAGLAYAILGTMMRRGMQQGVPVSTTLFVLSSIGVVLLTFWTIGRIGIDSMLATSTRDWWTMLAAGIGNAVGFFSLAHALRRIPVIYVQLLNATQAALAAAAGWLLFQEQITLLVQIGLALTVVGLIVAGTRSKPVSRRG